MRNCLELDRRPILSMVGLLFLFVACFFNAYSAGITELEKNLEPFIYKEDFESNELNAWASYPLWQDTAFDPNFRVGRIVPGDPDISIIQRVTPYTNVDTYAGAQKKMEIYLVPCAMVSLRYYLKSELKPEFIKIRIPTGNDGVIDFTILNPPTNAWAAVTITYADLVKQNPRIDGKIIKANGLAVLAKFPKADPAMPIYLGLDDIVFKGARTPEFRFIEPKMYKLSEWKPYIPQKQFHRREQLALKGRWPVAANKVSLRVADFTARTKTLFEGNLKKIGSEWQVSPVKLNWPEGLYLAELTAYRNKEKLAGTEFTIFIAPNSLSQRHPRLWFDSQVLRVIKDRLKQERFKSVAEELSRSANETRKSLPLESVIFDLDIFPKDEPLLGNVPRSIYPWFDRIRSWRAGLQDNSLAYALLEDKEAGEYAKALLVRLGRFPYWLHPWFKSRGQHIYYPVGELGMDLALGYDLVHDLLSESERKIVREALWRNVVIGCHKSYVEDNLVTSNTSNWVAHITGGSLMCQAAIYGDGQDVDEAEPYLTGVLLKMHEFIQKSVGRDGGYGESYGYCSFTMESLAKAIPALNNVFHIDFSGMLDRACRDLAWAGLIKDKLFFHFGDSGGKLGPMTNWAWLLAKNKDPLLGWLYHFLKQGETLLDVIYKTEAAPRREPFGENPVRAFWDIGTTVFKSGWEKNDFVFVLRTGAFYNHQHLDQGTFWLADRASLFIEERQGSTYYDDPIYQSHYTQPIAHSTILIDHNAQSQRVGDPLLFIEGLNDHAFIHHFLDGQEAAFVAGDIGRLYWGKVKEMRRNVLYLKPRTILMLDTIVPAAEDVDVTLLYQTSKYDDIQAGDKLSRINKGKNSLEIHHLWPEKAQARVEETPLYINSLKTEKPLLKEGLLTVTARTEGKPLVMANLLATTAGGKIELEQQRGEGCVFGKIEGREFIFSLSPGQVYHHQDWITDALAMTWSRSRIFAALMTTLIRNEKPFLRSTEPMTCEFSEAGIKYFLAKPAEVLLFLEKRPREIFHSPNKQAKLVLPAGEGTILFKPQN